jgi:hypothetical protein
VLVRREDRGAVVIGQPAHAWLSGQLARAWGGERFGVPSPREEVCLGATQHDIGMSAWDNAPTLNPDTGLPHSFLEMPALDHVRLWSRAARLVVPQSRYAALLVSLHGTGLYERRDTEREGPEVAQAVCDYLDAERRWQEELLQALRVDPEYAQHAEDAAVERNRALVRAWDWLSICLCMRLSPQTVGDVPDAAGEPAELRLEHRGEDAWTLTPWPFAEPSVTFTCEGRRLQGRFGHERELHAALERARWVTLRFGLAVQ